MAQVDLLNVKGEKVGTLEISDFVFNIDPNYDVMWRYVDMQLSNRRAGTASTKTRGEVSGGGRKPWPQKHTGRARHGSIRSPIWRHGGIAHGPKPRDWSKKLNKKMKKLALRSALSVKYRENKLFVLDDLKLERPKTKFLKEILQNLQLSDKKTLIVLPWKDEGYMNVKLSGKNLPNVKVIIADNPNNSKNGEKAVRIDGLNVFDMLKYDYLVLTQDMVSKIEEVLGNEAGKALTE
ncbi:MULTISPECIES: 50S ribosomal protein L4 [Thermotoga]|jgi:large subunit ribosomal protein L4|uniref:Large ribosomal subunit protein uL4 n=3 Tax=Thermotoga TaxID=2335 RepID=RL4_THEP1|nr:MULTISPECIES: 50S ribosomal protein L4 [Thermotoga]A5IM84.1 RecName: Full=Large ribosomal subunit protein uL4; AltName: Full=50S ribosomal protein L4 [Thermotoga petrophila RKU-1]B1LBN9.1 RecName: Full=Large ribosomal subunit protein uL4; AltName: Full=50S ribosomal protein L4 [Thermotoga sp. RQ2]HAA82426.1 50S ribosomal protein L4 [Thermotoga petrophila]HBF69706.1 50S ribosomal protein L4 [Thermotoga sp.]ABQ47307.1 LSU ribosomal protein L4P [Thermotoga petrophila RKU-1]ACB09737.1 ribosoma